VLYFKGEMIDKVMTKSSISDLKILKSGWVIVWIIVTVIVVSFVLWMPLHGEDVVPRTTITSVDDNGNYVQNGSSIVSTSIMINFTGIGARLPLSMHPNSITQFVCSLDGKPCPNINPGTRLTAGQQHNFAVRAVDTQGMYSNPATFSWTILTPQQATQKLINKVLFNLPKDVTTSLEPPLKAAVKQLNRNITAACNQLNARQTNGQLKATDLIQQGTAVQHAIRCSNIWSNSSRS
jgi:hypothetical protein